MLVQENEYRKNQMKYKQLGQTGIAVSEVAFGCMSLGMNHQSNAALLRRALDQGINLFDTADLYDKGANEETVGRAFAGMRNRVYIATKVGNQWRPDGSGWDWNPRQGYILQAVEASLRRLQTDYIDLYQLHGGTIHDPIDETIEAFERLKEQGKIRHYGLSSIRPNVIRAYAERSNIASVMLQYSLLDRRPEEAVLDLLEAKGIGVLTRGSLAQGLLAGKPAKAYLGYTLGQVQEAANLLEQLSGDEQKPSALAVRYSLHHPAVSAAVLGIRTNAHLADALLAPQATAHRHTDLQTLKSSLPANRYSDHR